MSLKKFISDYGITSSQQLIDLAKELNINLKFVGITNDLINMKEPPRDSAVRPRVGATSAPHKPINNGSYIVNIGDPGSGGTHWTSFYIQGNEAFYFDSYNAAPEDDLIDILNLNSKVNKVIYNNQYQLQHIDEQLCGVYAIVFLYNMQNSKKKKLVDKFNDWASKFHDLD